MKLETMNMLLCSLITSMSAVVYPSLFLVLHPIGYLLSQSYSLGIDVLVVDGCLPRALDIVYEPW